MRKYDTYKDSGIEWIGEIPGHWITKKIKHRCTVKARVGWKGLKSDEFLNDGYSYLVTGSDFKNDSVNWKECYHIDKERYEEDPYIQLQNEDLLITKDGTIGKLAIVKELDKPACLNSGIFVVRSTNEDFSTEFLFWILRSKAFTQFNDYTSYGSTIQHLYQNVFVEFSYPFPTPEEQTVIAAYLDHKTAEIDELIADKKRLLELYEEEKTAIINQAVTKGINPDATMKDSGVEWLGEIPEGWSTTRINRVIKVKDGTHDTPNYLPISDYNYPLVTSKDFKKGEIDFENSKYISEEDHEKIVKRSNTEKGDIIMSMIGGNIGNLVLVNTERPFSIKNVCLFKTSHNEIIAKHLYYILKSDLLNIQISLNSRGGAQGFLSLDDLRSLVYFVLPLDEIQSIVYHIETECSLIDAKKAKTEKLIELLTEYRIALISEVVTGKIKIIE
ncbi:MAG: restriction endonuclease subunit S [Saprospiraceae bacterium]